MAKIDQMMNVLISLILVMLVNHCSVYSSSISDLPPRPPSIRSVESRENSLIIKWVGAGDSEKINQYTLMYRTETSSWLHKVFPAPERNEYELSNLMPGTLYEISLQSMVAGSSSKPSESIFIATLGGSNIVERSFADRSSYERDDRKVPPYLSSAFVIPITIAVTIVVIVCAFSYVYLKCEEIKAQLIRVQFVPQSPSKNFQYINGAQSPSHGQSGLSEESSLSLRYSDHGDRSKPLMARPPVPSMLWAQQQGPIREEGEDFPSPYGTLPVHQKGGPDTFPTLPPRPQGGAPPPPIRTFGRTHHTSNNFHEFESSSNNQQLIQPITPSSNQNQALIDSINSQPQPSTSSQPQPSSVFCKADVHHDDDSSTPANDFFTFHRV